MSAHVSETRARRWHRSFTLKNPSYWVSVRREVSFPQQRSSILPPSAAHSYWSTSASRRCPQRFS